jgi:IS4 transposase
MTNIPVERLSAEDIASLYGARWEIEMTFKELKSYYRMDQIDSANPNIIKSLVGAVSPKEIGHIFVRVT